MPITLAVRFTVHYEILEDDESEPWQVETPDGHEASFETEAEAQAFADDANAEHAKELKAESKAERKALASELAAVVRGLSLERLRELEKWLEE